MVRRCSSSRSSSRSDPRHNPIDDRQLLEQCHWHRLKSAEAGLRQGWHARPAAGALALQFHPYDRRRRDHQHRRPAGRERVRAGGRGRARGVPGDFGEPAVARGYYHRPAGRLHELPEQQSRPSRSLTRRTRRTPTAPRRPTAAFPRATSIPAMRRSGFRATTGRQFPTRPSTRRLRTSSRRSTGGSAQAARTGGQLLRPQGHRRPGQLPRRRDHRGAVPAHPGAGAPGSDERHLVLSDGELNQPSTFTDNNPCRSAINAATQAKAAGTVISETFFNQPSAGSLTSAFQQVGEDLTDSRLIPDCTQAPPAC
jgi:hypothetical protein